MKIYFILVFLHILTPLRGEEIQWLEESKTKTCCVSDAKETGVKKFTIKSGTLENSQKVHDLENAKLYIRDMDNVVNERNITGNTIAFTPVYKGSYYLYLEQKFVKDDMLYINISSLRIYNKEGNITKAFFKEVRGKTNDSNYNYEPIPELPFQMIMERSIRKHHINCCLYSGDIARFKIYYKGILQKEIPLHVTTKYGWTNTLQSSNDGVISFEIPRDKYKDTFLDKRFTESMLVEADYIVHESGTYEDHNYSNVHYSMTLPLTFFTSPLEYTSELPAYFTVIGVMLLIAFGIYYSRKRKKRSHKEIWFEEN